MMEEGRRISTVLAATDLSLESVGAALLAGALAARMGAELHLAYVVEGPQGQMERLASRAREELDLWVRGHGLRCAGVHVLQGDTGRELLRLRGRLGADLVVLGRYGRGGPKPARLGGIAEHILLKCPVSVLLVQPEQRGEPARIGVASSFEEIPEIELRRGLELAALLGLPEIVLMHTFEVPPGHHMVFPWEDAVANMERLARDAGERIRQTASVGEGPGVRLRLEEGPVVPTLTRIVAEEGLDLLVMSTHAHTPAAGLLLGSTTGRIAHELPCTLWSEKHPALARGLLAALREYLA